MTWKTLDGLNVPPALTALGQTGVQGLEAIKTVLEGLRTQAQAVSAVETVSAGLGDVNAAVGAVTSAVNTALSSVLDDVGVYVLPIPVCKRGTARFAARPDNPDESGSNFLRFPANRVLNELSAEDRERLRSSGSFQQVVEPQSLTAGGNAHALKTLAEALYDSGDDARPRLTPSSAFAYVAILAGASDLPGVMAQAVSLDRLLNAGGANHVGASRGLATVVAQNVRVTPSGRGRRPVVSWDLMPPSSLLESYDNSTLVTSRYAIIRSKELPARSARKVGELFPSTQLTPGMTGLYGAEVLAVRNYDGVSTRYIDEEEVPAGETRYYHLAVDTILEPAPLPDVGHVLAQSTPSAPIAIGFDALSGCAVYVGPERRVSSGSSGTAPDWIRTPSVAQVSPAIEAVVDRVQEQLRSFAAISSNVTSSGSAYLRFLQDQVQHYAAQSAQLSTTIQQLQSSLGTLSGGAYVTLRTGTGGSAQVLSDFNAALNDFADPNRPPFDAGDEFVVGAFFLVAGPNPAAIAAAFALLGALFTPASSDPVLEGIAAVATSVAVVEAELLAQLQAPVNTPSLTFNADMSPRAPGEGDASCE